MLSRSLHAFCLIFFVTLYIALTGVFVEPVAADPSILPQCSSTFSETELDNPDVIDGGMGTVRTFEGCLQRRRDRLVVVTQQRRRPVSTLLPSCRYFQDHNETVMLHYLSSDLCRMGHTTKDVPHLLAFLIDYLSPCASSCLSTPKRLRVHLTIIFGNACMSYPRRRPDASFHRVIYGWYEAVFHVGSPFIALLNSWNIDFVSVDNSHSEGAVAFERVMFDEIIAQDVSGFFCRTKSMPSDAAAMRVIVRWERFRWFRTRAQAALFRRCLLWYFKAPVRPANLNILLLSRPNERKYDEKEWSKTLSKKLMPCGISVKVRNFVSLNYHTQVSLAHDASVLIGAHGAGLVNMVAMQAGSVVIELFPHGFRYAMYQELAELLDLHYIPYEGSMVWPPRCCGVSGYNRVNNFTPPLPFKPLRVAFGYRKCKECDIKILPEDMDTIINDAVSLVSSSTRLSVS